MEDTPARGKLLLGATQAAPITTFAVTSRLSGLELSPTVHLSIRLCALIAFDKVCRGW